jgi:hypothetical protein
MSFLQNLASGLRSLLRKEQTDQELDEELRTYLDMAIEEKMKQGSGEDAARAVRLERGSLGVAKETVLAAGWESFCRDLLARLALRPADATQGSKLHRSGRSDPSVGHRREYRDF